MFGFEDLFLEALGAGARLAALFLALVLFFQADGAAGGFEVVAKFGAGPVAIGGLGALPLAADFRTGGFMAEHDGGGGLVDFLSARTGATDEGLGEIFIADAELFESLFQRGVEFEGGHDGRE